MLLGLFRFVALGNVARVNKRKVMTKVSVLGQANEEKKELRKIELKFHCGASNEENIVVGSSGRKPNDWQNIVLISRDFYDGMDLILAYDESTSGHVGKCRSLMLGHWNDGVV